MAGNNGKPLQDETKRALDLHKQAYRSFWYRFADTHAARSVIENQPGDYLWLIPDFAMLVECKSTITGASFYSLLSTAKAKAQLGKHRLWHRAGHPSLYVYGDEIQRRVSIYDGVEVAVDPKGVKPAISGGWSQLYTMLIEYVDGYRNRSTVVVRSDSPTGQTVSV